MIRQGSCMNHRLQLLTWNEVTSIQAQTAMPKEVNDFCSLGIISQVGCCALRRWSKSLMYHDVTV